jgi:hypothetical protein
VTRLLAATAAGAACAACFFAGFLAVAAPASRVAAAVLRRIEDNQTQQGGHR